jgi:hypothetical protein
MKTAKFYWNKETIDYYADFNYLNGWAITAIKIYEYVADECDWVDEEEFRLLYADLLDQVEEKIIKESL